MEMEQTATKLNPGDGALGVRFDRRPVQDQEASSRAGRPIFKEVDFIHIWTPGDKTTEIDVPVDDHYRNRFSAKYDAYLAGKDQDSADGTPLAQWTGLTSAQVQELVHFKVKTVEQLAEMSDDNLSRLGPGYVSRRKAARTYLDAAAGNAPLEKMQEDLRLRDEMIEQQKIRMKSMEDAIKELQKKVK
jgi:hypothetical protein